MPAETPIELDLRGLKCPMPVLRIRKALRGVAPGASLTILASDPLAVIDIPHFLQEEGHRLEAQAVCDGISTFRIIKRS